MARSRSYWYPDIPSEGENEDKTVEVEETRSWTEIILEDDSTVAIIVPFKTSVCCKEVFITHSALDKHVISSQRYIYAIQMRFVYEDICKV